MSVIRASYWLWGVWYSTWWVAAVLSAKVQSRPKGDGGFLDRLLTGFGVGLLFFVPVGQERLTETLWIKPASVEWLCLAGVVSGFAFCWWGRLHLGKLWSGLVAIKADHRIVDTGPYSLVRHPIYSGVIFSAACEGILKASLPALVGAVLVGVGFALTARKEERFLRRQSGLGYDGYAQRVACSSINAATHSEAQPHHKFTAF